MTSTLPIDPPADATELTEWTWDHIDGVMVRGFEGTVRAARTPRSALILTIFGRQYSDGTVERRLRVAPANATCDATWDDLTPAPRVRELADTLLAASDRGPQHAGDLRRLVAALLDAADEIDGVR